MELCNTAFINIGGSVLCSVAYVSFQILYCKLDPDTEMNPYIQRTTAKRKDYDQGEFESVSYFMTFYELCLSTN